MFEQYEIRGPSERQYRTSHVTYTVMDKPTGIGVTLFYEALTNPLPPEQEIIFIAKYAFDNMAIPAGYESKWTYYPAF